MNLASSLHPIRWLIGLMVVVMAAANLGCNQGGTDGQNKAGSESESTTSNRSNTKKNAHERMLDRWTELKRRVDHEHPFIGTGKLQDLQSRLTSMPANAPLSYQVSLRFELGKEELRLAREKEAIKHFAFCRENVGKLSESPAQLQIVRGQILFELAVAYLRLGETQNCCLRNNPESCILPIQGEGIHTNREGSEGAIGVLEETLAMASPESELYWKSRWLLNIAYMTLGDHPEKVPPKYLIPSSAFESSEPFVRFKNISKKLKIDSFSMCGGVIIDDFDNDNYLDLMVSPWDPDGQLRWFRNAQDGTFAEQTVDAGLKGLPGGLNLIQADYDNDGNVDVLVLRGAWLDGNGRHPNSLLRNNGDGTFTDVTLDVGMVKHYPTQTAAWADFDNDGDLDLYVGNEHNENIDAPSQLYRNEGNGTFKDVADQAGVTNLRFTKGVVWGDYDGDRYPDLFVSNLNGANRLYHNNGDGTFSDVASQAGVDRPERSFPAWFWDFDNDGSLDLYVSAYSAVIADIALSHMGLPSKAESSALYRGNGKGQFEDVTRKFGLTRPDASMGANFGDIDSDGYLDFYLGTGYPDYASVMPSVMYRNKGGQSFVDVTTAGGFGHLQKGHAIAFADLDNDGDQDVFEQMGGAFPGDRFNDALYENPGLGNQWITLVLRGTTSNRSAIGARICAHVVENGKTRKIYRHVTSGGSFGASPLQQLVGLGKAETLSRLEIYWPTTDKTQVFESLEMNRAYEIIEGQDDANPISVRKLTLGGQ